MGLGPFVSLVSTSGKVGKTVEVLGQGFTGTTAVSFNGTPATFKVVSATFLKATVPSGHDRPGHRHHARRHFDQQPAVPGQAVV